MMIHTATGVPRPSQISSKFKLAAVDSRSCRAVLVAGLAPSIAAYCVALSMSELMRK